MVGIKLREAETRASQVGEQGGGEGRDAAEAGGRVGEREGQGYIKPPLPLPAAPRLTLIAPFSVSYPQPFSKLSQATKRKNKRRESFHRKTRRDPSISPNLASLAPSLSLRRSSSNHNLISAFRAIDPARPLNYPPGGGALP